MKQIKVFSEKNVRKFKSANPFAIISIQDPFEMFVRLPRKNCVGQLKMKFYDFDTEQGQEIYDVFLFEKKEASDILTFVDCVKDKIDILCVNCVAGVSRSAGVASALSKIYFGNDDYYFKNYCPNMRVYRYILNEYYKNRDLH